jgi:subtilisin family serine protease
MSTLYRIKYANKPQYTPDGLDLGDFISATDIKCPFFQHRKVQLSSWHGSHVIGTIASNGYDINNQDYITGGAPGVTIVPIRVLGKGGGLMADIINGMRWAAGLEVRNNDGTLVPLNPNPAQIINMSLGVRLVDPYLIKAFQNAVDEVIKQGVIIVVAAGNNSIDIKDTYPANLNGVISVAARGPTGKLAHYSNFGNTTITASGGDSRISGLLSMVRSTIWSSSEEYQPPSNGGYGIWKEEQGTSMAAPHVSAAVAILISILQARNEAYTLNSIIEILQKSAIVHSNRNNCNGHDCATNYALDVQAALNHILPMDKTQWSWLPSWDNNTIKGFLYGVGVTICAVGITLYCFYSGNAPHVKTD